eukprot:c9745_g1_i1.p1 GENE.c9745_g1_i1~~c9745_g1_i1.p1  ORF type:complete len:153 (+),score=15.83 c9745_g1_i1:17-475(+)
MTELVSASAWPLMTAVQCGYCKGEFLFPSSTNLSLCPFCKTPNTIAQPVPIIETIPVQPKSLTRSVVSASAFSEPQYANQFVESYAHAMDCKCTTCFQSRTVPIDVYERAIREAYAEPPPQIHGGYKVQEYEVQSDSASGGYTVSEYKSIYE